MTGEYPEEILRGISSDNQDFITPEGYPTQAAFQFDAYDANSRNDNFCELSINWVDDEGAVATLLDQVNTRKNCPQFQGGYCKFSRIVLEAAMRDYITNEHLSYERRPIEEDLENGVAENKYHGNILMKNNLSKQARTNIQVTLAGIAGAVIPREG